MEIESTRRGRIFWLILGLVLAGGPAIFVIILTVQTSQGLFLFVPALPPIGLGIGCVLWLGRPAWIKADSTTVTYIPPLGPARVFLRSEVRWLVHVPSSRGGSSLELRDQGNRRLVRVEQGFAKDDMQKLAQFLNAKFTWDPNWNDRWPAAKLDYGISRAQALQQRMATMTPEERAELEKHMRK